MEILTHERTAEPSRPLRTPAGHLTGFSLLLDPGNRSYTVRYNVKINSMINPPVMGIAHLKKKIEVNDVCKFVNLILFSYFISFLQERGWWTCSISSNLQEACFCSYLVDTNVKFWPEGKSRKCRWFIVIRGWRRDIRVLSWVAVLAVHKAAQLKVQTRRKYVADVGWIFGSTQTCPEPQLSPASSQLLC